MKNQMLDERLRQIQRGETYDKSSSTKSGSTSVDKEKPAFSDVFKMRSPNPSKVTSPGILLDSGYRDQNKRNLDKFLAEHDDTSDFFKDEISPNKAINRNKTLGSNKEEKDPLSNYKFNRFQGRSQSNNADSFDQDLLRALEESRKTAEFEANHRRPMTSLSQGSESNSRLLDEEIQRAIEESKKTYEQELNRKRWADDIPINEDFNENSYDPALFEDKAPEDEDYASRYYQMLNQCAEQENSDISAEEKYDLDRLKPEEDESVTEPIGSMMDPNELNEAPEMEMEITTTKVQLNNNPVYVIDEDEIREARPNEYQESQQENQKKYWGSKRNYHFSGYDMFTLTHDELSQAYIQQEQKGITKGRRI